MGAAATRPQTAEAITKIAEKERRAMIRRRRFRESGQSGKECIRKVGDSRILFGAGIPSEWLPAKKRVNVGWRSDDQPKQADGLSSS